MAPMVPVGESGFEPPTACPQSRCATAAPLPGPVPGSEPGTTAPMVGELVDPKRDFDLAASDSQFRLARSLQRPERRRRQRSGGMTNMPAPVGAAALLVDDAHSRSVDDSGAMAVLAGRF